jgi:hypothetical protein
MVRWERRKKPVNSPNPSRAGATQAYHKGRGISFGGVHDVEESEEGIDSEFFNQLYAYNIDRNRFFQLSLRRPRTSAKKVVPAADRGKRGRGKANEDELLANLKLIEDKVGVGEEAGVMNVADPAQNEEDDDPAEKVETPVMWEMPHPRFNAQLTVQDDTLYMFGGTFEKGDREYTFDEMWSIDLGKLDGVKEVFKRELEDWQGSEDEESEDDDEDEGDSEDEDDDEDVTEPSTPATSVAPDEISDQLEVPEPESAEKEQPKDDRFPYPRPFESLRDFFTRTSNEWQDLVLEGMKYERDAGERSVKEIRKIAFNRADVAWWDSREEIQALEDEQEAAGIGEVVNLDEKGGGHGAGRRR